MDNQKAVVVSALIITAMAGVIYWQQIQVKKAEESTGVMSSRVISAIFTAKSDLRVAVLSGQIFAEANGCSLNCWVPNGQKTRAPYSVDYFINLKRLPVSAFRWNEKDNIMAIDMPDITVSRPNIDMSRAMTKQSGSWISRDSSIEMQRKTTGYLADGAKTKAESLENMAKARQSARTTIERFVAMPLAAAGLSSVKVVVRFPGDPKPSNMSNEQWDVSRPMAEVLAERQ